MSDDRREPLVDATESENLSMRGNSMRENRETREVPPPDGGGGRSEKAYGRALGMHASRESDGLVILAKRTNKAERSVAEPVEERGSTKGNDLRTRHVPDTGPAKRRGMGLEGVRQAAKRDKKLRFTALLHHVSPDLLRASYFKLKRTAAPGMDDVTWAEYRIGLEGRIEDLHDRIHRGAYRAQPSKRAWIPKADGRQRPLGIATLAAYCTSCNKL